MNPVEEVTTAEHAGANPRERRNEEDFGPTDIKTCVLKGKTVDFVCLIEYTIELKDGN
jgi:hypothetical protein